MTPATTIGIDIGSFSIKCVACDVSGDSAQLVYAQETLLPPNIHNGHEIRNPQKLQELVRQTLENIIITGKQVALALPRERVRVQSIDYPGSSPDEALQLARWDYPQYLPEALLRHASVDFVARPRAGGACVDVIAADTQMIEEYLLLLKDQEIRVDVVDVDIFAVETCYERSFVSPGLVILLDVGHEGTRFSAIFDKVPDHSGYLAGTGGLQVIDKLCNEYQIGPEDALEIVRGTLGGETPDYREQVDNWFEELGARLSTQVHELVEDRYRGMPIGKIVLTGGCSSNMALAARMVDRLETQVEHIARLQSVEISEECAQQFAAGLGPWATAIGLSLRGK